MPKREAHAVASKNIQVYCLKDKKMIHPEHIKVVKAKNGRMRLSGICPICHGKVSKFLSSHEGSGLLSMLGIKTPLSNIPLLGDLLF